MDTQDIIEVIVNDPWMMRILQEVARVNLPDWWIGAGFVRNKVWDVLHGYKKRTPLHDVDVIYFDRESISEEREKKIERGLQRKLPSIPWSVKNQARMAIKRSDDMYTCAEDGLARWVETVTCIGVRLNQDNTLLLATPVGIKDLVNLVLRPNKKFYTDQSLFLERVKKKQWLQLWPKLQIVL